MLLSKMGGACREFDYTDGVEFIGLDFMFCQKTLLREIIKIYFTSILQMQKAS